MPVRVEELHHALEEGIALKVLRAPREFVSEKSASRLPRYPRRHGARAARRVAPARAGRRPARPRRCRSISSSWRSATRRTRSSRTPNPTSRPPNGGRSTSMPDRRRPRSMASIRAGTRRAAARPLFARPATDRRRRARSSATCRSPRRKSRTASSAPRRYTDLGQAHQTILRKVELAGGIVEFTVHSPLIARAAEAGQFVRLLPTPKGELIPLTLADWDADAGTIDLVIQAMGASTIGINAMEVGEDFSGIAGPLGQPSRLHRYEARRDGGVRRRRARPAAGLPDHAGASAAGQPCHADRRLPHRESPVLDGQGRARSTGCSRNSRSSSR